MSGLDFSSPGDSAPPITSAEFLGTADGGTSGDPEFSFGGFDDGTSGGFAGDSAFSFDEDGDDEQFASGQAFAALVDKPTGELPRTVLPEISSNTAAGRQQMETFDGGSTPMRDAGGSNEVQPAMATPQPPQSSSGVQLSPLPVITTPNARPPLAASSTPRIRSLAGTLRSMIEQHRAHSGWGRSASRAQGSTAATHGGSSQERSSASQLPSQASIGLPSQQPADGGLSFGGNDVSHHGGGGSVAGSGVDHTGDDLTFSDVQVDGSSGGDGGAAPSQPSHKRWFKNNRHRTWTAREVDTLYEGLRQFGTNFTLIATLFASEDNTQPTVTRDDVKAKYHAEMRSRPDQLKNALATANRLPIDVDTITSKIKAAERQRKRSRSGNGENDGHNDDNSDAEGGHDDDLVSLHYEPSSAVGLSPAARNLDVQSPASIAVQGANNSFTSQNMFNLDGEQQVDFANLDADVDNMMADGGINFDGIDTQGGAEAEAVQSKGREKKKKTSAKKADRKKKEDKKKDEKKKRKKKGEDQELGLNDVPSSDARNEVGGATTGRQDPLPVATDSGFDMVADVDLELAEFTYDGGDDY